MSVAEAKSSTNGVIRIARKGIVKFAFGEDGDEFPVDVRLVYDAWREVDWQLRNEKGELPSDKWVEHGQNRVAFVQNVVNNAYALLTSKDGVDREIPQVSGAEAIAFIDFVYEEVEKVHNFFSPKKDEPSSSPASQPEVRINFSQ